MTFTYVMCAFVVLYPLVFNYSEKKLIGTTLSTCITQYPVKTLRKVIVQHQTITRLVNLKNNEHSKCNFKVRE